MAEQKAAAAVEAMVAALNTQLEGVDIQALSRSIADRPAPDAGTVAINSFGTAGTAGSLTGCFGTAGTFGSLGAQEIVEAGPTR